MSTREHPLCQVVLARRESPLPAFVLRRAGVVTLECREPVQNYCTPSQKWSMFFVCFQLHPQLAPVVDGSGSRSDCPACNVPALRLLLRDEGPYHQFVERRQAVGLRRGDSEGWYRNMQATQANRYRQENVVPRALNPSGAGRRKAILSAGLVQLEPR